MPLVDTPVSGMEGREIGVLTGDYVWDIVTGKTKRINGNLVALESKFGWLIQGAMSVLNVTHEIPKTVVMHVSIGEVRVLSDQICSFWEMESLGIQMETETKLTMEGEEAQKFFIQTIKEIGGRYEVRLPWRTENVTLSPNYKTALHRFNMLVKRFRNNQSLYNCYSAVIKDNVVQEIIEHAKSEDTNNPVYYLPYHTIIREERSTSLGVVFDASSHEPGQQSLNDCLLTGPNLTTDLLGTLLKFRQHRVAIMSDILPP